MKLWGYIAMVASVGVVGACGKDGATNGGGGAGGEDEYYYWGGTGTGTGTSSGTGTWTSTSTWTATGDSICGAMCARAENQCSYGNVCEYYGVTCSDPSYECSAQCVVNADCEQLAGLIQAAEDPSALDWLDPAIRSCVDACWGSTSTGTYTGTGTGTWTDTYTGTGTGTWTDTYTGTGTGTWTDTSATCDNSGDCATCLACAQQGPCADQTAVCQANADCVALNNCAADCSDQACVDACVEASPNGVDDLNALITCAFDNTCPVDCQ